MWTLRNSTVGIVLNFRDKNTVLLQQITLIFFLRSKSTFVCRRFYIFNSKLLKDAAVI
jgi:hypothetical protein